LEDRFWQMGHFLGHGDVVVFDFFRSLYNDQLKFQHDCEVAFQNSVHQFYEKFGYRPYASFEDYLSELFNKNNGFEILDRHI
jgi:hypothetical protein